MSLHLALVEFPLMQERKNGRERKKERNKQYSRTCCLSVRVTICCDVNASLLFYLFVHEQLYHAGFFQCVKLTFFKRTFYDSKKDCFWKNAPLDLVSKKISDTIASLFKVYHCKRMIQG